MEDSVSFCRRKQEHGLSALKSNTSNKLNHSKVADFEYTFNTIWKSRMAYWQWLVWLSWSYSLITAQEKLQLIYYSWSIGFVGIEGKRQNFKNSSEINGWFLLLPSALMIGPYLLLCWAFGQTVYICQVMEFSNIPNIF